MQNHPSVHEPTHNPTTKTYQCIMSICFRFIFDSIRLASWVCVSEKVRENMEEENNRETNNTNDTFSVVWSVARVHKQHGTKKDWRASGGINRQTDGQKPPLPTPAASIDNISFISVKLSELQSTWILIQAHSITHTNVRWIKNTHKHQQRWKTVDWHQEETPEPFRFEAMAAMEAINRKCLRKTVV